MKKLVAAIFCSAVLFCSSAMGEARNKKTMLTFGQSVALPGIVLEPGTYVFKVPDFFNYRHVVQVYSADESKLLTTIIAAASERQTTSDRTALRFGEGRRSLPEPLERWFYPQDKIGQQFIYSKPDGHKIASR